MTSLSLRTRDFWDRISPRERRLVVIAAFAVPLTLIVWLSLAIHDGLGSMEERNDKMRKALSVVADLHARGPMVPVDDTLATMGIEPISLDTYLTNAAQKAGIVLKGTSPRNPVTRAGFVTSSVSFQLSDLTIDELKKFLQGVEGDPKVVVTHLDLKRHDYKGKDKIDASFEVSTYSKEPPPKGEGSGSATATGSDKKGS